ncbi:hypothetical protein EDD16DRAFT_942414 [Pisolithus croceorrhizus]|nr:hypothetical protein EDD16DRAFT_942414 [Pisolithus croceorrhizus]
MQGSDSQRRASGMTSVGRHPPPPSDPTALLRAGSVEAVETITGRQNINPRILGWALIHPSIDGNGTEYHEQLEFIGDAILDFVVVRYIVDRYGKLSPGCNDDVEGGHGLQLSTSRTLRIIWVV